MSAASISHRFDAYDNVPQFKLRITRFDCGLGFADPASARANLRNRPLLLRRFHFRRPPLRCHVRNLFRVAARSSHVLPAVDEIAISADCAIYRVSRNRPGRRPPFLGTERDRIGRNQASSPSHELQPPGGPGAICGAAVLLPSSCVPGGGPQRVRYGPVSAEPWVSTHASSGPASGGRIGLGVE